MANVADGATGTVLTAPSPATSCTSIVLNAGEGYRYPEVPFYAVAHANNSIPVVSTSEKVQVTAQGKTTIAAGSNGVSLPQSTINVASATTLLTSGTVTIVTSLVPRQSLILVKAVLQLLVPLAVLERCLLAVL